MKKKFLLSALAVLAASLVSSSSFAQIEEESLTFSPLIGGYIFEGNQNVDDDLVAGLAAGYNFTENWGVEGVFQFLNTEDDISGSHDDIDGRIYHLDALYHFMADSKLVPYVAAGLGGITLDDNPDGHNTNPLYNYGGGVKYFLNENMALRGDVRHVVTFDDHYNNLVYAVGMTFQFPTKPKVVETVAPPPPEPEPAPVVEKAPEPKPVPPPPPIMEEVSVTLHILFDRDTLCDLERDLHLFDIFGIDISRTAIQWAEEESERKNLNAKFLVGNVLDMPFDDEEFDFVLDANCFNCIIEKDRKVYLRDIHRVLKPKGLALFMCKSTTVTRYIMIDGVGGRYLGSPFDISEEIKSVGFRILHSGLEHIEKTGYFNMLNIFAQKR